jgi:hypothetical protein
VRDLVQSHEHGALPADDQTVVAMLSV